MKIISKSSMSISMKKATSVTSIKHNNREFKKEDWETKYHKHIDPSRSQNNQYLIQKDIHTVFMMNYLEKP